MKESNTTYTYTCDGCDKEMDSDERPLRGDHGHVKVEPIHSVWGKRSSFDLHYCPECRPESPLADDWDTISSVVFNTGHPNANGVVTAVTVKWVSYMSGESKTDRPQKFNDDIYDYAIKIEKTCYKKYNFEQDGPSESGW